MSCQYCYYPYYQKEKNNRSGILLPLVGGILIGGIISPYIYKNNYQNQYPPYNPYMNNYPPQYPTYQMGNYTYPYSNGFYHY